MKLKLRVTRIARTETTAGGTTTCTEVVQLVPVAGERGAVVSLGSSSALQIKTTDTALMGRFTDGAVHELDLDVFLASSATASAATPDTTPAAA